MKLKLWNRKVVLLSAVLLLMAVNLAILTNGKKITGINTSTNNSCQVLQADQYLFCLGATANNLLSGINLNSNIYPIKGYSLSIPAEKNLKKNGETNFDAPKIGLTDSENKIVYSRLGNIFRAAGTIEIAHLKQNFNNSNIKFLNQTIKNSLNYFGNLDKANYWCGFRPFRPNSIPLICQVKKYENLFLNVGHGSLGLTLAFGSGQLIAKIIKQEKINEQFSFLLQEEQSLY